VLSTSEDGAVETSKESIPTQARPEVPIRPEAHPAPESEALQEAKEPPLSTGEPIHSLNKTKDIVSEHVEGAKETDHPPLPQDVDQTLPLAPAFEAQSAVETDHTVTPHPEVNQSLPPAPAFEALETAKEELAPPQSDIIMAEASDQQNQEQSLPDEPLEEDQASVASFHVGSSVALSVCHSLFLEFYIHIEALLTMTRLIPEEVISAAILILPLETPAYSKIPLLTCNGKLKF
jgi:hypothetical protein